VRRAILPLALPLVLALAAPARPATTPACDGAVERYEKEFGSRSDDAALAAAKALETPCSGTDAAKARAVSRQAYLQFLRHDLDASVRLFERSVRLRPDDPTLRMSLCGVYTEAQRYGEAIETCTTGFDLAKEQDDGSEAKHAKVLDLGFNLALAKVRRGGSLCGDRSIRDQFEAYRAAHPDHGWVHQLVGAWVWDCEDDFERGLALYKRSCALGHQPSCEQVRYTEACRCETRQQ
jgi:hypothetical protein